MVTETPFDRAIGEIKAAADRLCTDKDNPYVLKKALELATQVWIATNCPPQSPPADKGPK